MATRDRATFLGRRGRSGRLVAAHGHLCPAKRRQAAAGERPEPSASAARRSAALKRAAHSTSARVSIARARAVGWAAGVCAPENKKLIGMSMSMSERTMLNECILRMISARAFSTRKCSGTCQGAALSSGRELQLSPRHAQTSHKVRGAAIDSSCHLHHAQGCKHTQSAPQEYPAAH